MPEKVLTLRLLTPGGEAASVSCDSVQLAMCPDSEGKKGGLVGIQPGHAAAVIALDAGTISASLEGVPVLRADSGGGFVSVRNDVVTVLSDTVCVRSAEE